MSVRVLAAKFARALLDTTPSETGRAQGMPGNGLARGPPANRKAGGSHHRFSQSSGIPCAMVLTVSCVLTLGTGLSCSHRRAKPGFAQLDTSVGVSGPHAFSVRIGAVRPHENRTRRQGVHRILPPRVVTTRDPPLLPGQDARIMPLIWGRRQDIFCKPEDARCDKLARRAIRAWRACKDCPSCRNDVHRPA
jgi:hypothetical protein